MKFKRTSGSLIEGYYTKLGLDDATLSAKQDRQCNKRKIGKDKRYFATISPYVCFYTKEKDDRAIGSQNGAN